MDTEYIPTHVHEELGDVRYVSEEDEAIDDIPGIEIDAESVCRVIVLEGQHEGVITTVEKKALSRAGNLHRLPEASYEEMRREYSPYATEDLLESKGIDTPHDYSRHDAWLLCKKYEERPTYKEVLDEIKLSSQEDLQGGPEDQWDKQLEEDLKGDGPLSDLVEEAREDHRNGNTEPLPGTREISDPSFPMDVEIRGPDEEGNWAALVPKWSISAFGLSPSEALRELSIAVSLYEEDWDNVPAGTAG